jgi:hypothetical protein
MSNTQISQAELIKMVLVRFLGALLALSVMFFLPAGTWAYWEAWLYLGILLIPLFFVLI